LRYLDWLDALEFFLRNPRTGQYRPAPPLTLCAPLIHVVDNRSRVDSLLTLAARYSATRCGTGRLTWRDVADANFHTEGLSDQQTQRVVNRVLATRKSGYMVHDGINYAFNPDVLVIVPDQKVSVLTCVAAEGDEPWWQQVIAKKTWKIFSGYEDPEGRASVPPIDVGYAPVRVSPARSAKRRAQAAALRRARERAYSADILAPLR
jgi:hypothetical protein